MVLIQVEGVHHLSKQKGENTLSSLFRFWIAGKRRGSASAGKQVFLSIFYRPSSHCLIRIVNIQARIYFEGNNCEQRRMATGRSVHLCLLQILTSLRQYAL